MMQKYLKVIALPARRFRLALWLLTIGFVCEVLKVLMLAIR